MTTCSTVGLQLSDYVDGETTAEVRADIEQHLASCDACQSLVRDLRRIQDAARSLGSMQPPPLVWQNISASLPAARRTARAQWLGLAAALVLVTAGAYFVANVNRSNAPSTTSIDAANGAPGNASKPATVETVEQELATAAKHYEAAIVQLEAVAKQDQAALPADAAAKLQTSLAQIDKYIAESRAALVSEPQSEPARDSLFEALRRKVSVLQDTVALVGAMQRGDQQTAAKIMGGKSS